MADFQQGQRPNQPTGSARPHQAESIEEIQQGLTSAVQKLESLVRRLHKILDR